MSLQKTKVPATMYVYLSNSWGLQVATWAFSLQNPTLKLDFHGKIAKNKLSNKSTCIIILSCLDFWRETHLNSKRDHHYTNVVGRSSILSEKDHRGGGMQIIIQQMLLLLVVLFLPFNLQLKNP